MAGMKKMALQFSSALVVLASLLLVQVLLVEADVRVVNDSTSDLFVFDNSTNLVLDPLRAGEFGKYPLSESGIQTFVINTYSSTNATGDRLPLATLEVVGNATLTVFDSKFSGGPLLAFSLKY